MARLILRLFSLCMLLTRLPAADEVNLVERARNGVAEAQFSLGYKYATGDGVQKDSIEAAKWYRMAAENEILPNPDPLPSPYAEVANGTIPAIIVSGHFITGQSWPLQNQPP